MHRCAPPAALAPPRLIALALVALSCAALFAPDEQAAAATGTVVERQQSIRPGQSSFVVPAGSSRRLQARVNDGVAKVTLRMTRLGRRPASLHVRAGNGARWHGRLRGQRSRRMRLRVRPRGHRLNLVFRARGTAVRIRHLSVTSRAVQKPESGQPVSGQPTPAQPPSDPTSVPPSEPTPQPGIPPIPSPDFTTLAFSEEFTGPAGVRPNADHWWSPEVGGHGWGNGELQSFTDRTANAALDGSGGLDLVAREEEFTGSDGITNSYTSARLITKDRFSFQYGKIEARIKPPAGAGLWPNFWIMGDDVWEVGWPESGEINIMEMLGHDPFTVHGTLHAPLGSDGTQWQNGRPYTASTPLTADYHVFGLKWWDGGVEWLIDGVPYHRVLRSETPADGTWVFDKPFHLRLSMAVGGSWPGPPNAQTQFPATMHVDWVRVYQ